MNINIYLNKPVQYKNNQEYRNCIREIFRMQEFISTLDIDDETKDEQNYDDRSTSKVLDYIYSITKKNACFQELYGYAAATMFSTDPEIGLAVLFSYDYFLLFHPLLCSVFHPLQITGPIYGVTDLEYIQYETGQTVDNGFATTSLEKNPHFIALKKKLC
jgi:hypothetical protein